MQVCHNSLFLVWQKTKPIQQNAECRIKLQNPATSNKFDNREAEISWGDLLFPCPSGLSFSPCYRAQVTYIFQVKFNYSATYWKFISTKLCNSVSDPAKEDEWGIALELEINWCQCVAKPVCRHFRYLWRLLSRDIVICLHISVWIR